MIEYWVFILGFDLGSVKGRTAILYIQPQNSKAYVQMASS